MIFFSDFANRESTFKTKINPRIYKENLNWLKQNLVTLVVIGFFFFLTKCEGNLISLFSNQWISWFCIKCMQLKNMFDCLLPGIYIKLVYYNMPCVWLTQLQIIKPLCSNQQCYKKNEIYASFIFNTALHNWNNMQFDLLRY